MTMAPINNLKLLNLVSSTYPRLVTIYAANQWPLQSRNRSITTNELSANNNGSNSFWNRIKKRWDLGDGLVEKMLDGAVIWEVGLFGLAAPAPFFCLLHFETPRNLNCFSFASLSLQLGFAFVLLGCASTSVDINSTYQCLPRDSFCHVTRRISG